MRWLVDVTSLGKSDKESIVVESESWQKALQGARAQRGETAPMSGFSIELLDDGCRAIDPVARLRYEVHKAPAGASVPAPAPAVAAVPAAAPASVAPRPIAPAMGAPSPASVTAQAGMPSRKATIMMG